MIVSPSPGSTKDNIRLQKLQTLKGNYLLSWRSVIVCCYLETISHIYSPDQGMLLSTKSLTAHGSSSCSSSSHLLSSSLYAGISILPLCCGVKLCMSRFNIQIYFYRRCYTYTYMVYFFKCLFEQPVL